MDAVDAVRSGHSRIVIYGDGEIVFGAKRSNQWTQWTQWMQWMQWTQWTQYAVHSMQWNSGIWWWGHCSLVEKGQTSGCSAQWMQYAVTCSGIVVYGGGDIVFGAKRVKPVDALDAVHSGRSMQWMQ